MPRHVGHVIPVQRRPVSPVRTLVAIAAVVAVAGVGFGTALVVPGRPHPMRRVTALSTPAPVVSPHAQVPSPPPPRGPAEHLVRWRGPVEAIFVHPLVLDPALAFTSDRLGQGFANYFVTAREFRGILRGLWRHGWSLVDVHDAASGHVWVPPDRKPLVLYEDDVNYYRYFRGRGLASRLVLDDSGRVRAEVRSGHRTRLTADDVVPLVDAMVARHPSFSSDGAKGVLALTGYEGFFGEHDLSRPAARQRVRDLAARLREDGWTIASHTYGHITLASDSLTTIRSDIERWRARARGLLGHVDVLVYPFGSVPTLAGQELLRDEGFPIQVDIDIRPSLIRRDGITVLSRRHIDGLAFDVPSRQAPFFSVARVRDPARP